MKNVVVLLRQLPSFYRASLAVHLELLIADESEMRHLNAHVHARPTSGMERVTHGMVHVQPLDQYGMWVQTACNDCAIIVSVSFLQCSTERKR